MTSLARGEGAVERRCPALPARIRSWRLGKLEVAGRGKDFINAFYMRENEIGTDQRKRCRGNPQAEDWWSVKQDVFGAHRGRFFSVPETDLWREADPW